MLCPLGVSQPGTYCLRFGGNIGAVRAVRGGNSGAGEEWSQRIVAGLMRIGVNCGHGGIGNA